MRRRAFHLRGLVIAAVAAALTSATVTSPSPAAADPVPAAVHGDVAPLPPDIAAYLDAHQRLPDARAAVTLAKRDLTAATEAAAAAQATAHTAALDAATAATAAAAADRVLAVAAAADTRARRDVAGMARAMYMTGGSATPLDPFLANPDSAESLTRAMDTQSYLASASSSEVADAGHAAHAHTTAAAYAAAADTAATAAAATSAAAEQAAGDAAADLAAARARLTAATRTVTTLESASFVPADVDYTAPRNCGNDLVLTLARAGFDGENLREAWAIAMRESGGVADIGPGHPAFNGADYGLFQLNKPTWGTQPWWDDDAVRDGGYNARIAHMLSRGGTTWYAWGLDGHGRPNADAYVNVGWSPERITSHIVIPYLRWYAAYPCA